MKNGDLKRFYGINKVEGKDFVRYDANKNIKVGTASGNDDAMSKAATQAAIEHAQLSVYKPGGSKAFAQLPTPSADYLGYVYNVTDAFTTDSRFVEGAGKKFPAGTNVAIIIDGENYYYDIWVGGEDYDLLANIPIINQDLDDAQFTPQSGKYYRHIAKPAPIPQAFAVGDIMSVGDKYHFDTSKESELLTFLQGLTYDDNMAVLAEYENSGMLIGAGHMNDAYIFIVSDGDTPVFIYSNAAIAEMGIEQGWQNLDESGNYTCASEGYTLTVSSIDDTNPPTWNGVFVYRLEGVPESSFVDGKIYYYDGQYNPIPGAASVTAANVNSESATNGQVLMANGSGGAVWGNLPAGGVLNKYYFSTSQYTSANIARIGHILNNGIFVGGTVTIGNEIPLVFKVSESSQSSLVLTGVYTHGDNETRIVTVIIDTAYETVTYRMVIISSTGTVTVSAGGDVSGTIRLAYLAESEITA